MAIPQDIVSTSTRHPFGKFAKWTATASGHPFAFILAALIVIVWLLTGPVFNYSDTWQLVINTGTTIITFLMVFLIQNTQNRDSVAMQIKLDELIRSSKEAHNAILEIEELTERELAALKKKYASLAAQAREDLRAGRKDKGSPDV